MLPEDRPKGRKLSALAQIDTEKSNTSLDYSEKEDLIRNEESLVAVQENSCGISGKEKWGGDAVELPHDFFEPQQAVSALSSLGFKASFGNTAKNQFRFSPAIVLKTALPLL